MDGIDHLLNLIAIVKSEGFLAAFTEDADYGGQRSENTDLNEPLRSLRRSLEDSKLCMEALNSISTYLKKKIRHLQRRCVPFVLEHGIKIIPDEILAHIFESGHQMSEDSEFALRISHVSHRFRQVSLQAPLLWTRLSSRHSEDQIDAFISRSGKLDLEVALSDEDDADDTAAKLRSFLQLAGPHSDRWSGLLLAAEPVSPQMMEEARITSFPHLRYINQEFYDLPNLQWNTPLLSRFRGYCLDSPHSVTFLSQLTCMELSDEYYFDLTSFAHVLHRMSNLRNLSLQFHHCDGGARNPTVMPEQENPELHSFHLESLKVTLGHSVGFEFVESLYAILAYFTASLVDISLLTWGNIHPRHFLINSAFPYGSTVRLQIECVCTLPELLKGLLKNCKILRSVQFEKSNFNRITHGYIPPTWSDFPSFRHIRFHDCVMSDEKHVGAMARSFLTGEAETDFRSLEIISCHKISEEFLEDLQDELGERLIWSR
ncbi:hypothetical protein BD410DRAFT_796138 [Rickenella mellea]|uniref:Uncharacterized protein n=1 Tax=Rickenella mellea TaxID=50990 RepID=A0A4Y7PL67_9AGAM|nr:hypothetical protein BD410DRAFT_796138 [Rickenella mellea]